jgi:hypothetical protein
MSFTTRLRRTLLTAALAAGAVTAIVPATSSANAIGYAYWGGFSASPGGITIRVPAGQLSHTLLGSGTWVSADRATAASVAPLCDPSIVFTYGNGAMTINGGTIYGCSPGGTFTGAVNRAVPRGNACATLYVKRGTVRVAQQCHYVH